MSLPLVSVIIPTYNNARFLPEAIISVRRQDYGRVELIVVDDGSTDGTTAVLTQFDDLQLIRQANAGSAAARNAGLAKAQGELVIFLDADDYFLPGRLAAHVDFLQAHPEIGVAHSGWQRVTAVGEPILTETPWRQAPNLDLADWLRWKPVFFGAMTFRREWLERVGGLNPALRQAHDVDVAWRLALAGCRFGWVKRPLVAYRQHETNTTKDGRTQAASLDALLDDFFSRDDLGTAVRQLEAETRRQTWLWCAYHLVKTGQLNEASRFLAKAESVGEMESPFAPARQAWLWALADKLEPEKMLAVGAAFGGQREHGENLRHSLPKISVIIPAHNNGRYLPDAIISALSQHETPCEIIVVDDGSTDETGQVLADFGRQIRAVRQENRGVCAARNRGLQMARGELVVFLDADDVLLPGKLAQQAAMLGADAGLGAVHSGWLLLDEGGRPYQTIEPWHEAPHLDLTDWLMWKPAYLGGLMFRREWLARSGGFDESLVQAEDVDLLWRLAQAGCRFGWLKEATVGYRQHGGNTVRHGRVQAENLCRVLDKFFNQPDCPAAAKKLEDRVRYYTLLWLAWRLFRTGGEADVPRYLRQSLAHAHFPPELAISHWLAQMAQFARQDGAINELRGMWPAFRAASGLDDGRWAELAPGLDWWLDVWRPFLDGDEAEAEANLAAYRRFSPRQLVRMAQSGVLVTPRLADTAVIRQFWAAARRLGLVTAADDGEVTALHLTTMAHALFQHRWGLAAKAAANALRHTGQRRGVAAWGRFMSAAWAYYGGRP